MSTTTNLPEWVRGLVALSPGKVRSVLLRNPPGETQGGGKRGRLLQTGAHASRALQECGSIRVGFVIVRAREDGARLGRRLARLGGLGWRWPAHFLFDLRGSPLELAM